MEVKAPQSSNSESNSQVFTFGNEKIEMSRHQPIDIKPTFNNKWLTNGLHNSNFQRYEDAYDDSPTNQSIINAYVNYIVGDGLVDKNKPCDTEEDLEINQQNLSKYISQEDVALMCMDYKKHGGFACQVIFSYNKVPLRIEYLPIRKLGVSFECATTTIDGYWFSWDWTNTFKYHPVLYPLFTGAYKGNDLEILVVRRATAEPFFPVPDYFSGLPWAEVEGELANSAKSHFDNIFGALTVINYNNGKMANPELAKSEAKSVREKYCGSNSNAKTIVSFNEGAESAVTVDQLSPPELNQQNVFFSEEAEKKLIVAHSAPPILFQGSNSGSGFSSNAEELAMATKVLYRRHINPMRKKILNGLQSIFNLLPEENIKLDLYDFKEETELENNTQQ